MSSYSPWGGLGEPGEVCVRCGGKETTLGARAPTREASTKNTKTNGVEKQKLALLTRTSPGALISPAIRQKTAKSY